MISYSIILRFLGSSSLMAATLMHASIRLEVIGTYQSGVFDDAAAEIVAHHPGKQRLYIVNGAEGAIDVVEINDPKHPRKTGSLDIRPFGSDVQSLAIHGELIGVAVMGDKKSDPGKAVFFNTDGKLLGHVTVGSLPDMITFTPDGRYALTANEGEPEEDFSVNPVGTVSIIGIPADGRSFRQENVTTLDFSAWDGASIPGTHPGHPDYPNSRNFEPEYIAVSPCSSRAWVTLQESNAIAIIDIPGKRIVDVKGLGFKDHMTHPIDPSDRDGGIRIRPWPVKGIYQPDTLAVHSINGQLYLIGANEGDARDWKAWSEETRVSQLKLDPDAYPDAVDLQRPEKLGRLRTSTVAGDSNGDGLVDQIYAFGARSFSIWNADSLELVYDSSSDFEYIAALMQPRLYNADHSSNDSRDGRSDDKGVEPEAIAIGEIEGRAYAFIGFERMGGVAVYDISDPRNASFVHYINNRDPDGDQASGNAGDLGPECVLFVTAENSPTGKPVLIVSNEVSGTTTIYSVLH